MMHGLPHSQSNYVQGHGMGMHPGSGPGFGHGLQPSQSYAPSQPTLHASLTGGVPGMDQGMHGMHHAQSHLYTPSYAPPGYPMQGGGMGGGGFNSHFHFFGPSKQPLRTANTYTAPPEPRPQQKEIRECNDLCEEEQCDDAKCGGENAGPNPETFHWGIDPRPLLPFVLGGSTVVGAAMMWFLGIPRICQLLGWESLTVSFFFGTLYSTVLGLMVYCIFCDPGEMSEEDERVAMQEAALMQTSESFSDADEEAPKKPRMKLPKRAKKMWQYQRPVLRYDHYCKWLTNAIGLWNHRQFFGMVSGLMAIGVLGVITDGYLAYSMVMSGLHDGDLLGSLENDVAGTIFVVLHSIYSLGLMQKISSIFTIHCGLISRCELADEWKNERHSFVPRSRKGENIPVDELSEDEHNALFAEFQYDPKRNPWDKGLVNNWMTFWFTSRWSKDQKGEF